MVLFGKVLSQRGYNIPTPKLVTIKTVLYMSYARCVVMSVNHGIILNGVGITSACSSSAASDVCTCAPAIWICSSCES